MTSSTAGHSGRVSHDEILLALGRCVYTLQRIELVMKDLLMRQRVEGPVNALPESYARRAQHFAGRSLGQLVDSLEAAYDEPKWELPDADDGVRVAFGFTLGETHDDRQSMRARLKEFVSLRNDLIHHFAGRWDLSTEEGRRAAAEYLSRAQAEANEHFSRLEVQRAEIRELTAELMKLAQNPAASAYFLHGIRPDGEGVDWPAATIVRLLRRAESECSQDGWTQLGAAIRVIRQLAPEHTPRRYGCASWPQVLHEARPLFDVRRAVGQGPRVGRTWYRSNTSATNAPLTSERLFAFEK